MECIPMKQAQAVGENEYAPIGSTFIIRTFYGFSLLAALSVAISLAGKWFGHEIALAGHTESTVPYEIVLGNNVLKVPANMIRFERARRDGIAERLDIYLRWPDMTGYTKDARDDFNNLGPSKNILFLSFERQIMSRDMSGRFDPIYRSLIAQPGKPVEGGVVLYEFTEKSGYSNELLAVADRPGDKTPFVARCLSGPSAEESLAGCERDILVGDDLSLSYRFSRELLGKWQAVDEAVLSSARKMLQTGR